jgi:hypothetical protein
MNSLGFKQSNILTDIRLAIGFTACAIAGATFYYDYTLGWDKTKAATLYAVVAYFTLNTLLTWWIWWVEGGKVYIGERDGVKVLSRRAVSRAGWGEPSADLCVVQVVLESHSDKYSPVYELKITQTVNGKATTTTAKNSFSGWFNQLGYFVEKPFMAFIQNSIPALSEPIKKAKN